MLFPLNQNHTNPENGLVHHLDSGRHGLLLLDEPLSALDAKVRAHLRHEMKDLQRRLGVTTVMVTHDQEEALTMADRIVVMNHGVIEQVGTPTQIYREPDTLFVADFIGAMNQVSGRTNDDSSIAIGELSFKSRAHGLAAESAVVAAIRPEDIVPQGIGDFSSDAADLQNSLEVEIVSMEFLGSFWRVSLHNSALGGASLIADMSINALRRLEVDTGSTIRVKLPSDRLWIFPPAASA